MKATCPTCGRMVNTRTSPFGDRVFNSHKMAVISSNRIDDPMDKLVSGEMDWRPGVNPDAEPIWNITCPMSGQAVEET